ncbi:3-beta hydroxysteroid dehydrogenase/isomerase family-domain-containing protein [Mycena galericulata]|nr:3-beta hydroxysteroid dehydrogenase/isomerase family-domain-containing protein [Mycena galericulata]
MAWMWILGSLALSIVLLFIYTRLNDHRLTRIPERALSFSPVRTRPEETHQTAAKLLAYPISISDQIPPRTGRRYIVVGGAGFVGGWIVLQLLERGEDPRRIRVVDIRAPVRPDLKTGRAKDVHFIEADITDAKVLEAVFNAPWADEDSAPITVFHTVATIRVYERVKALLPISAKVNVSGTQNVIDAARAIGATVLVCTSSGSVAVRSSRFFLWPWETEPRLFVQAINEDDALIPKEHSDFYSNYAVTKMEAERRVRGADKSVSRDGVLRTGCIRPANGIFGPGGDTICGAFLIRKVNPSWIHSVVQNFVYVENVAVAHLLYEQRLIGLSDGGKDPDIGGQAFIVTDPGPPSTYSDVYTTLSTLTNGETTFPFISPTLMLFVSHIIEWYYLARLSLLGAGYGIAHKLPALSSDVVQLQPSIFSLVNVHLIFDDSRARLPPEKGGLGYKGAWTTLEGVHKTVEQHKLGVLGLENRSDVAEFGLAKVQGVVGNVADKVSQKTGLDPLQVLAST